MSFVLPRRQRRPAAAAARCVAHPLWLVLTLFAVAGCSEPITSKTLHRDAEGAAHGLAGPPPAITTIDDRFAALSDEVPGFGGLYYDAAGRLHIFLASAATLAAHRADLVQFVQQLRRGDARGRETASADIDAAVVHVGRYSARELLTVYRGAMLKALPAVQDLSTTDIDETTNRIAIGVTTEAAVIAARAQLLAAGIPDDMVEVHVETPEKLNSNLTDLLNPTPGGAYIRVMNPVDASWTYCTLGYNLVRYMGTTSDTIATRRYMVTASHCTPARWARDSSNTLLQVSGTNFFAIEVADYGGFTAAPCMSGYTCRYADAAIFQYYDNAGAIAADDGRVALPSTVGSTSFTSYSTVTRVDMPYVGMGLTMVGAISGRQNGSVVGTCVNIWTSGGGQPSRGMLCQGKGSYFAQDGDSGAPVMTLYADGTSATGIHYSTLTQSGQTYRMFSYMQNVLGEAYDNYPSLRQLQPIVY
jgi:hypothetical protein